jgi:hypothetical protein
MIGRIILFIFIPVFIWMMIGGYKQIKRDYNISDDPNFLFKILWLLIIGYGTISVFTYALFGATIVGKLKYW